MDSNIFATPFPLHPPSNLWGGGGGVTSIIQTSSIMYSRPMAFPFPQLARSRQKSWRRCPSCPSMTPSKQIQWSTMVSKLSTAFLLPFSSLSLFLLPFSFISSSSSPYFFLKALTSSSFLSSSCSPLFLLLSLCPPLFLLPFFHLSLSLFFFFSYFSNTVCFLLCCLTWS